MSERDGMDKLGEMLRACYGLGLDHAEHIDYGMWEESFSVWTDQGRVFVKRFLRRDRNIETMLAGLRLSQSLRDRGFPAPRVIPTLDGRLIAEYGGERYQASEWVDGRSYHPGELPIKAAHSMGAILARFHRLCGETKMNPSEPMRAPREAISGCQCLLMAYQERTEPFAEIARAILQEQLALLESLSKDLVDYFPRATLGGPCFGSFWVEQLIFRPDHEVAALVDWTDGAGKGRHWVHDLNTALHLSVLDFDGVAAFVSGYQSVNPLPLQEWRALVAELCYGWLASTGFLAGWLQRPYRRMNDWEQVSTLWHRQIPTRFRQWEAWEKCILASAGSR